MAPVVAPVVVRPVAPLQQGRAPKTRVDPDAAFKTDGCATFWPPLPGMRLKGGMG